jgi:Iron-containing redox enzyme
MLLPQPRGPLSEQVTSALRHRPTARSIDPATPVCTQDAIVDEDLQLALWVCYELHYRGFDDAADGWEWYPALLGLRAELESAFGAELNRAVAVPTGEPADVPAILQRVTSDDSGPSLSRFLERTASRDQFREFVIHRSIYHLKEADPHSFAIPRLEGRAKAAMLEIQYDEYGAGTAERMHSELFRHLMRHLSLDDTYGHYLPVVPAVTLAVNNLISYFGLHRNHRDALAGHLAAFEMTSPIPNRRYSHGLRRLGGTAAARRFYDEHVEADAVHEQVAAVDLCGGLVKQHSQLADGVLFGAACCLHLDARFTDHLLRRWADGHSSLHPNADRRHHLINGPAA